jgi:hypothetical protein
MVIFCSKVCWMAAAISSTVDKHFFPICTKFRNPKMFQAFVKLSKVFGFVFECTF